MAKTITANGNAQVDTAQSKFGGASGLFDGTGDFLSTPDHADFNFGSGDFTVDFWVRFSALTSNDGFEGQQRVGSAEDGHYIYRDNADANVYWRWRNTAEVRVGYYFAPSFSINTWYHLAFVRSGTTFLIFKDGISQTLTTENAIGSSTLKDADGVWTMGRDANNFDIDGWIDEYRVSNTARWTSNFTPPTAAYSADANTKLLIHCDGTDGSTTFTDDDVIPGAAVAAANHFLLMGV